MNNEEYTPDIVSIVDEEGKEHIFEELDRIETDSGRYIALLPIPETPDQITEEDNALIILKVEEEANGETYLCPIEDDAEFNEVGMAFEERLADMFEFDNEEE
ncbi:MAG: DUF1292 domain-containing protein [Acutalibacteraceae bacterium]|nr:DUF1292 domain-containing protein [Acutalibacteraceae bacterium]